MKFRKEHVVIIFLIVAFIVFFVNVMIVLTDKNRQIDALQQVHEALQRDHEDLREEKLRLMKLLDEKMQPEQKQEKEDSKENK